ncbi:MAG: N-acetylmuramoyl-L-alanine amidase [Pseudomonadota bacterium]
MITPVAFLLLGAAGAAPSDLDHAFQRAAEREGVPVVLLQAIGWEATRWDQSANSIWHGWGVMDLMEGEAEPSLEHAARLLDVSPDLLIRDARWNIAGGAALLANQARLANHGALPAVEDLPAWWDAVRAFARHDDPGFQAMYAATIYDIVNEGFFAMTEWGPYQVAPVAVDVEAQRPIPVPAPWTDYAGAYQFIAASSSNFSNYSRGPGDISYVVVHTTQGSYSGCISWFQNPAAQCSAHYVVRSSDGQITQMVWEEDVAWHAGNWSYNLASVGIEHEGYVDAPSTWYTDAMYRSSAALTADICARQTVSVDRSHIIGHVEVPGATHTDPGSGWDWDYYMSLVSGGEATASLTGVIADSDIYNGARITGASVWLDSGESAVSDGEGYYVFDDVSFGAITVHAVASGYQEGSCTKEVTGSGTWWCSIALLPAEPDDTGTGPTDDTGTGPSDDTGTARWHPPGPRAPFLVGEGCGCASKNMGWGLIGLALGSILALVRRR